jgi:predicted dehydrogenase
MQRGLHCMVVKPLVPTLREWAELRAVQQQHNVYGVVEFHKRFDESNIYARRAIRSGALGDLLYVSVHYSQKQSIPLETFRAWAARSNIFQYLGVHYIDQIYYCSGALPRRALATGQRRLLAARGVDTYDAIQALIEWEQPQTGHRFTASLLTNWIDPLATSAMSDQHITYVGTRGRLECEQKERGLRLISDDTGIQDINPYFSSFQYNIEDTACDFRGYGYTSLIQFLRDCAALQQGHVTPDDLRGLRATFADCRASTAVIEAVNLSLAHDGAWITIDNEHSEGSKHL